MSGEAAAAVGVEGPEVYLVPVRLDDQRYRAVNFARAVDDQGLQQQYRVIAASKPFVRRSTTVEIEGHLYDAEILQEQDKRDQGLVETDDRGRPVHSASARRTPDDSGDLGAVSTAYCEWVRSTWVLSDGLSPDTKVSLDSDFVEPTFREVRSGRHGFEEGEERDLVEVIRTPRVVVLGEPGSGKTSLLRKLAYDLASGHHQPLVGFLVPVYVQLRDLREDEPFGIATIERILQRNHGASAIPALRSAARSGQIALLVDGLDEISSVQRDAALDALEEICEQAPNVRVVLSSRESAYPRALAGFTHVRIRPFDQQRIARWSYRYVSNVAAPARRELVWRRFHDLLTRQPDIREMVRNPLLLAVTTSLYARYDVTPRHKATLFERYMNALLDEWDYSRGIRREGQAFLLPKRARTLLRRLSFRTTPAYLSEGSGAAFVSGGPPEGRAAGQGGGTGLVDGGEGGYGYDPLESGDHNALEDGDSPRYGEPRAAGAFSAEDFTELTAELAWPPEENARALSLLQEIGVIGPGAAEGGYTFTHRSMREYLRASYLVEQTKPLADYFHGRLRDDEIAYTWLLSCGMTSDPQDLVNLVLADQDVGRLERLALLADALAQDVPVGRDLTGHCCRFIRDTLEHDLSGATVSAWPVGLDLPVGVDLPSSRPVPLHFRLTAPEQDAGPLAGALRALAEDGLFWRLREMRNIPSGAMLREYLLASSEPAVVALGSVLGGAWDVTADWDAPARALVVRITPRPVGDEDDGGPGQPGAPGAPGTGPRPSGGVPSPAPGDATPPGAPNPDGGPTSHGAPPSHGVPPSQGPAKAQVVRVRAPDLVQGIPTLWTSSAPILGLSLNPADGTLATASRDGSVRIWDPSSGRQVRNLKGHDGPVNSVAFDPEGRLITSAGSDGTVRVWEPGQRRHPRVLEGHVGPVHSVMFSPDGDHVVSGGWDGTIRVWDARTGEQLRLLEGHIGQVCGVAFNPTGDQLASCGDNGNVRLWETSTGRGLVSFTGHSGYVNGVTFSPDGTRLATAGADRTVRLWDVATGAQEAVLTGHQKAVDGVAFGLDGRTIASTSGDEGSVRLWSVRTARLILTFIGRLNLVGSNAFSLEGRLIAGAEGPHTHPLWPPAPDGPDPSA